MTVCLLSGVTGQDGSYLSELLIEKGCEVHGIVRRSSTINTGRIDHLERKGLMTTHFGDLADVNSIVRLLAVIKPDEIYNIGSMSHVRVSFDIPEYTAQVTGIGPAKILDAMRSLGSKAKYYQASCYSSDTRIVTPLGFKKIDEIKVGDKVLSANLTTQFIEEKPIVKIFRYPYSSEMVRLKGRAFDFLVTPNHQMLVTRLGKYYFKQADTFNNYTPHFLPTHLKWAGEDIDDVIEVPSGEPVYNDRNANHKITRYNTNDLLYLIGLFIGDGYIRRERTFNKSTILSHEEFCSTRNESGQFIEQRNITHKKTIDSTQVFIYIPESDECYQRMITTLNRMGISWQKTDCGIYFMSRPLSHYLHESCGQYAEYIHIPYWALSLPPYRLKHLYDGLIASDGCERDNHADAFTTISHALIPQIAELSFKLGRTMTFQYRNNRAVLDGREINSKAYYVSISEFSRRQIRGINVSRVQYDGEVWCVEVADNHNLLVERNGKVNFSGNSSEMFGISPPPQNELTPFQPQSPYGCAKLYAYWMTKAYRTGYGMFACNGILFNHESPRRGETFVTKKIVRAAVRIKLGKQKDVRLGNLEAKRDWGYAKDYMEAIYLIMHHSVPDDFVVATGEHYSVKEFAEEVFRQLGLNFYDYLINDDIYRRPNEVPELLGDATKIRSVLGWKPKVKFHELIGLMVKSVWDEENK